MSLIFSFLVLWYENYPIWKNINVRGFDTASEACEYLDKLGNVNKTAIEMDGLIGHRVQCVYVPEACSRSWVTKRIDE